MSRPSRIARTGVVLALLVTAQNFRHATCFAQGSLTPPGAPAPTLKTLGQIEPRTPISSLPFVITNSGSYYFTGTLSNSSPGSDGITIDADDVAIDLKGFTLIGGNLSGSALYVPSAHRRVVIRNGGIRDWGSSAVLLFNAAWCDIEQLQIVNSGGTALYLGPNSLAVACSVTNAGAYGISAGPGSRLKDCFVMSAYFAGFSLGDSSTVENSTARQGSLGSGFSLGEDCTAVRCSSFNNSFGDGFNAADGCVLTDCTASRNDNNGIRTGQRSKVTGCVTGYNLGLGGCSVGDGSVLQNCTAFNNSGKGFTPGNSCVVSDCAARKNGSHGIYPEYNNTVIGCTAIENTGFGIYCAGSGTLVKNCNASANTAGGIYAVLNCQIVENVVSGNGAGPNVAGIFVADFDNRIDGNHLSENHNIGLRVNKTNGNNLVIRNSASGTFVTPYSIAPGNRDAQVISPASGFTNASPWANFSF